MNFVINRIELFKFDRSQLVKVIQLIQTVSQMDQNWCKHRNLVGK